MFDSGALRLSQEEASWRVHGQLRPDQLRQHASDQLYQLNTKFTRNYCHLSFLYGLQISLQAFVNFHFARSDAPRPSMDPDLLPTITTSAACKARASRLTATVHCIEQASFDVSVAGITACHGPSQIRGGPSCLLGWVIRLIAIPSTPRLCTLPTVSKKANTRISYSGALEYGHLALRSLLVRGHIHSLNTRRCKCPEKHHSLVEVWSTSQPVMHRGC